MFGKHGIVGDFVMWLFLGAFAVLVLTHAKGFNTAVGTVVSPVEYGAGLIASAGTSTKVAPAKAGG